MPESANRRSI